VSLGDLLPAIIEPPPGLRSRTLARRLSYLEAPGVNTVGPGEPPILWEEAAGANVLDADGNIYLDLTSGFGVAAIGHRHPRVVAAVREQAGRLLHALGDVHAHPSRVELAARLVRIAPVDDAQIFFAISGSDAVEIALKTALGTTGKRGIVAFQPSYHGLTLGALAVTSRPEFRAPFAEHLHPHVRRVPFGGDLAALEEVLGRGDVACVLLEPIVGREGVLVPPAGWLAEVARLARGAGALLAVDEIFTGFGRTGKTFAVEWEGVRPDILCCGKALGGGLPIAAVVARQPLFRFWETEGEVLHTATFLANPLACAAALAVLDVLEEENLASRAARRGGKLGKRLSTWPGRFPQVAADRGRGLLWGVELRSREAAGRWVQGALRHGVLFLAGGPEGRVAEIVPPLTITEAQLTAAVEILEQGLAELEE
jgi:4-aminobutyrate aminotransferase/(S)-3-amino-2-methylpropionate transaminase